MTVATALKWCYAGVGLTLAALVVEFVGFRLHLFAITVVQMPFTIVLTLAPAIAGVATYQKALKAK